MPAIDRLMKRLGFVKLARYGLLLTPEGRIMSLRPAVLDDGLGGRIVGWKDGDLAAMELEKWEPALPAANQAVATRVATPPPPRFPARSPAVAPAVTRIAPGVAVAPQVDEDEWEWEIALARARVAAEDSELAARAAQAPARRRTDTVPPPLTRTQPMAVVSPQVVNPLETWPRTEPLGSIHYEDYTSPAHEVARVARLEQPARPLAPIGIRKAPTAPMPAARPPVRTIPRGSSPATIIPVPRLPSLPSTVRSGQLQPVVRAMPTPIPPHAPRRFPKGTGPIPPTSLGLAPPPPILPAAEDQTRPNLILDDKTSPSIALPAVARPVLPSIKQRLAR